MIMICGRCGRMRYARSRKWFNKGKCAECKGHFWVETMEFDAITLHS